MKHTLPASASVRSGSIPLTAKLARVNATPKIPSTAPGLVLMALSSSPRDARWCNYQAPQVKRDSTKAQLQGRGHDGFRPCGGLRQILAVQYLSIFHVKHGRRNGFLAGRRVRFDAVVVHPERGEFRHEVDQVEPAVFV